MPIAGRSKTRASRLMRTLYQHGIRSHLVGVGSSVDEVFVRGSIAIAHIYRAKGNEAPMVYVIDAQHAANQFNAVTRRNTLFTAITRSRAWVRISGWGEGMATIAQEVLEVRNHDFKLEFRVPTYPELTKLRKLNRDRSGTNENSVRKATAGLQVFMDAYERQEIEFDDLPPVLRTRLMTGLRRDLNDEDDF